MDTLDSRNRSKGRIARVVRKRLAPVAIAAMMLGVVGVGVGIPQADAAIRVPGSQAGGSAESSEASIIFMRKSGGEKGEFTVAQDDQQATSDFESNSDAVDSDWPPGPGIIAVL